MNRRHRKIAVRVLLFLLLGAIVNVAVAWGCALVDDPYAAGSGPGQWGSPDSASLAWWGQNAPDGYPDAPSEAFEERGIGYRILQLEVRAISNLGGGYYVRRRDFGWPLLSLSHCNWYPDDTSGRIGAWAERPIEVGDELAPKLLPIGVLLPGFAINTIFYALVLWMLFAFPFVVRRRRRIKRGLCVKCAYDLRGAAHAVCPECGNPVIRVNHSPA